LEQPLVTLWEPLGLLSVQRMALPLGWQTVQRWVLLWARQTERLLELRWVPLLVEQCRRHCTCPGRAVLRCRKT